MQFFPDLLDWFTKRHAPRGVFNKFMEPEMPDATKETVANDNFSRAISRLTVIERNEKTMKVAIREIANNTDELKKLYETLTPEQKETINTLGRQLGMSMFKQAVVQDQHHNNMLPNK